MRAHWVQSYFHLTPILPADAATLRITGYGVDNSPAGSAPQACCAWDDGNCTYMGCNSSSLTQQTSVGPRVSHDTNALYYRVDTEPANSGSPVSVESHGYAVAVHTNGGCASDGGGENKGTRLKQAVLSQYLDNFLGGAVFVDHALVAANVTGAALSPARTVPQGVAIAPVGGTVALAGGQYLATDGNTGVINKAVTLRPVAVTLRPVPAWYGSATESH